MWTKKWLNVRWQNVFRKKNEAPEEHHTKAAIIDADKLNSIYIQHTLHLSFIMNLKYKTHQNIEIKLGILQIIWVYTLMFSAQT